LAHTRECEGNGARFVDAANIYPNERSLSSVEGVFSTTARL